MNSTIKKVIDALEKLELRIQEYSKTDAEFVNSYGWNCPAITPIELAEMVAKLFEELKSIQIDELETEVEEKLKKIPTKIDLLITHNLPYVFNGNATSALPAFFATMDLIKMQIKQLIENYKIMNPQYYPSEMVQRVAKINEEIHYLMIDKEQLETKMRIIQDAHDAATNLPTTMNELRKVEQSIKLLSNDSLISSSKIEEIKLKTEKNHSFIEEKKQEAEQIISRCEDAYRTTTSQGLAKAFDDKAQSLSKSLYIWVFSLILALIAGSLIGSKIYFDLSDYITNNNQNIVTSVLIIKFLISLLSFGAPLWFAWLSTKQISERFKLAEDYAFKASVAKAYEGYRKEASRIDEAFEARLFSTALSRLEQEPLRFVNNSNHGSPWHELISSIEFQKAIKEIPEFKDKFIELAKQGLDKVDIKELFKKEEKKVDEGQ